MHTGRAKLWAWTASIGLHLIVLTVMAASEFSPAVNSDKEHSTPQVKVERIKQLVRSEPKIPKPKVQLNERSDTVAFIPLEKAVKPISLNETIPPDNLVETKQEQSLLQTQMPSGFVEFFSSSSESRRICFVVDCSGSMKGLFGTVRNELLRSISNLHQDQYFSIIFFGDDKLLTFENARLVRASNNAKSKAESFIYSVEPKGKTNATQAFEKLSIVRNSSGQSPSVIYFLTDGFELDKNSSAVFLQRSVNLLAINLPNTIVNTIGFWPDENDCVLLNQIAERTGGSFTRIGEKENQQ